MTEAPEAFGIAWVRKMDEVVLKVSNTLFGGVVATALTLIPMRWSTPRTIESAKVTLRTQLLYEERKGALKELNRLVEVAN